MYSYQLLERVLNEHCRLTDDKNNPIELKQNKEISSDSLQNPSDPDASYSGHKGQGYQVQVMETFCDVEAEKKQSLKLIIIVSSPWHSRINPIFTPFITSLEILCINKSLEEIYAVMKTCLPFNRIL